MGNGKPVEHKFNTDVSWHIDWSSRAHCLARQSPDFCHHKFFRGGGGGGCIEDQIYWSHCHKPLMNYGVQILATVAISMRKTGHCLYYTRPPHRKFVTLQNSKGKNVYYSKCYYIFIAAYDCSEVQPNL